MEIDIPSYESQGILCHWDIHEIMKFIESCEILTGSVRQGSTKLKRNVLHPQISFVTLI